MDLATRATSASWLGSMPRRRTGSMSGLRTASASSSMNGAAPVTFGARRTLAASAFQSGVPLACGGTKMRACAESDNRRSRSSPSRPFITDRMTMSAITPRHTHSSDTQVMKETKNLWERART